jgi:uncharacterized protein YfaS (alpha-2-macroglobulin family)
MSRSLLAVLLVSSVALGKPLYITVPRSYGSHEAPKLEVSFAERSAVELRVLKPQSLDAFLKQQASVRRAYAPPSLTANPGRALVRGLNEVKGPGELLRFSLGFDFRTAVMPGLEPASVKPVNPLELEEGPQRLIGIPKDMTLVRSQWLNLDLGGDDQRFDVPGFGFWGGRSEFQDRTVVLDELPVGLYVVQMVQGTVEGQVVLMVSDLSVVVKQASNQVLVRVAGRDQLVKAGVSVKVMAGSQTLTGVTDENGEATFSTKEPKLLVIASLGADTAVVDTDAYSTLAVVPDVFLYSDRPIYKPEDVVRFKGVLRQPDSALARLFTPKKREVEVALVSSSATVKTRVTVNEFGAFSGKMAVPANLPTGVLRLVATVDGPEHQSEVRVQDYVKPTFFVEVLNDDETVTPGQTVKAKIRARRYAGGAPAKTKFMAFLYRTQVDAPSWVDDSGLGGVGSAVTYGSQSTTEGVLSIPQKLYASSSDWEDALEFDAAGEAEVSIPVPALMAGDERKPWRYSISIRARDDQGTFANAAKSLFLADSDLLGTVQSKQKVVRPGEAVRFSVRATTLSGKAYGVTAGHVSYQLRKADGSSTPLGEPFKFSTTDDGVARLETKGEFPGVVEAHVTLFDNKGKSWDDVATAMVLGSTQEVVMQVPTLSLEALGGTLEPDDTAELVALFPTAWAARESTDGWAWVTLTGAGIFKTERVPVKGQTLVYRFPIERRFGNAVYASVAYPSSTGRWEERIAAFRIVPKERTLTVRVVPEKTELSPLTEQTLSFLVSDSRGRPVSAEVSVAVVDKAVYALQSEFRPGIVDFFYPLTRDDVSTFSSSEFQGYGYGDRLAMKLARFPKHAFASVKPPVKKQKEDDTVYWNPSIRTDRDGRAKATFKLNSMQTLWTATAVAIDASGRFGESTAEFASRGALVVSSNLPQFLRAGDSVQASVRLTPGQAGPGQGQVAVLGTWSGSASGTLQQHVALQKGGEVVLPFEVKTAQPGEVLWTLRATGIGDPIADVKRVSVVPASVERDVVVSRVGAGPLSLVIPFGSQVFSSQLTLAPTMVDVALHHAREMLTYPHGCMEQLVSTTVPNIALVQTLERLHALDGLDQESLSLLAEAKSRAVQGTARILDLAVRGGGFTWFSGYATPSPEMTLIALDGLAYAVEAGLLKKDDPRLNESANWLAERAVVPPELEPTRTYVLAKLQGRRHAAAVRQLLSNAEPPTEYALALTVLAAHSTGVAEEPEWKASVEGRVSSAYGGVATAAAFQSSPAFYRFPLRKAGLAAIVAHAASRNPSHVAEVRTRLLQLLSENELSTFERATVLLHSQWLIEHDIKAMGAPTIKGAQVALVPSGFGFSGAIEPSVSTVEIPPMDGLAVWKARVRIPLDAVQPSSNGLTLKRAYFVLRNNEKVALRSGETVRQGEDVYVALTFDAPDEAKWKDLRSAYLVLEDAIPAGFTPLQEDKAYRGAPWNLDLAHEALRSRAFTPQRITWYFEEKAYWTASARQMGYVMRAQFPGTFRIPPASVEDMYAASVNAQTESASLTVIP